MAGGNRFFWLMTFALPLTSVVGCAGPKPSPVTETVIEGTPATRPADETRLPATAELLPGNWRQQILPSTRPPALLDPPQTSAPAEPPPDVRFDPFLDRARSTTDVTVLISILKAPGVSNDATRAAVEALADQGPAAVDAVPALVDQLMINRAGLDRTVRIAIRAIGPAAVKPLLLQCTRNLPDSTLEVVHNLIRAYPMEAKAEVESLLLELHQPLQRATALKRLAAVGPLLDRPAIDAITRQLNDQNDAVRVEALEALRHALPREQWKPYFAVSMIHKHLPERLDALRDLVSGEMTLEEPLRSVAQGRLIALLDADAATRPQNVKAMIAIKTPPEVAAAVVASAYSGSEMERQKDPQAYSLLARQSDDEMLRLLSAYRTEGAAGIPSLLPLLGRRDETDAIVRNFVREVGPAAVVPVIECSKQPDDIQRARSIGVLSELYPCPADAVAALTDALIGDESSTVRLSAAYALGQCAPRPAQAWAALTQAARDPDPSVRRAALHSLWIIAPTARANGQGLDLQLLRAWLDSTDIDARCEAARLLAGAGAAARDATPLLARMTGNELAPLRRAAAEALIAIDPTGAQLGPAMINAVFQSDAETAGLLAGQAGGKQNAAALRTRLEKTAASSADPSVKSAATRASEKLGD